MASDADRAAVRWVVLVAFGPAGEGEAARFFGSDGALLGAVLEPAGDVDVAALRDAVWLVAMGLGSAAEAMPIAGIVFRERWGGGGIAVT